MNRRKEIHEYIIRKSELETELVDTNNNILEAEYNINILNNEYENPGDTSREVFNLKKLNAEYEKKQNQLKYVNRRIRELSK